MIEKSSTLEYLRYVFIEKIIFERDKILPVQMKSSTFGLDSSEFANVKWKPWTFNIPKM